ncbi:MAG: class I SAM-dependent methyltransferase [Oscillospiraceae bacterium]
MASYSRFAQYYDQLTKNISYSKRAEYFNKIIEKFGGEKGILLDLACGTGSLSEEFSKIGFDVIGIDKSQEMLTIALEKKFTSGLPIQYLSQDMTKLDMFGTIDITISALDGLNHLSTIDDVKKTFERVSLFTSPNGLFIFDVNTTYKHKKILANNTFVYDMENVYCVWQNTYFDKDCKILINLDFFEKDGNVYFRSQEDFCEYAFDTKTLDDALTSSGFEILDHYDYDSFNPPTAKSEKIIFVARKK